MNITVVGTGYVGLVTGVGLADFGLSVTCVDCDQQKIEALQAGKVPIYEIGLEEICRRNVQNGRLAFSSNLESAVRQSLVVFIAVGTPEGTDGEPDLSQIAGVARSLAMAIDDYKVVVTKSTVPVGTNRWLNDLLRQSLSPDLKFDIVSNPEFLREGAAIEDFMRPNRVVIGAESEEAIAIVKDIYRPLYLIETPFIVTNWETAELIKYAANAFLATKISFINEIANLCEKVGADIHDVAKAMGLDQRIGSKFLHPGPGFGGSCFPKDLKGLAITGRKHSVPLRIVEAASEVNVQQRRHVVAKMEAALGGLSGKTIAVLGLSFKPNTDDIRESPSIAICQSLVEHQSRVQAYDPIAASNAKKILHGDSIAYHTDPYEAATKADALVIATEWNEFRNIDLERIKIVMNSPVVFDIRNVFEPQKMEKLGFTYFGTGR